LVKIPIPEFVFMTNFNEFVFGNSKEYNINNFYQSTKKRFLFFLTNLIFH